MRLIGREKLHVLQTESESIQKWVCAWVAEISDANWKCAADVSQQFNNARGNGGNQFIFPVRDCNWVIHVDIAFPQGIALITQLIAEDETHAS